MRPHPDAQRLTPPAEADVVRLPADQPPVLLVVIDTEEEFDWNAAFDRSNTGVGHMRHIGRVQDVFDELGARPTYVIDYPVASPAGGRRAAARAGRRGPRGGRRAPAPVGLAAPRRRGPRVPLVPGQPRAGARAREARAAARDDRGQRRRAPDDLQGRPLRARRAHPAHAARAGLHGRPLALPAVRPARRRRAGLVGLPRGAVLARRGPRRAGHPDHRGLRGLPRRRRRRAPHVRAGHADRAGQGARRRHPGAQRRARAPDALARGLRTDAPRAHHARAARARLPHVHAELPQPLGRARLHAVRARRARPRALPRRPPPVRRVVPGGAGRRGADGLRAARGAGGRRRSPRS